MHLNKIDHYKIVKKRYIIEQKLLSDLIEKDTEFLPLMSDEDEAKISEENTPDILPILPLRNTVLTSINVEF